MKTFALKMKICILKMKTFVLKMMSCALKGKGSVQDRPKHDRFCTKNDEILHTKL